MYHIDKKESITQQGQKVIDTFNEKNIIIMFEKVSHDGFDEEGPESDLWDLYILEKTINDYIMHSYHRENWSIGYKEDYYKLYCLKLSEVNLKIPFNKYLVNIFKSRIEKINYDENIKNNFITVLKILE